MSKSESYLLMTEELATNYIINLIMINSVFDKKIPQYLLQDG